MASIGRGLWRPKVIANFALTWDGRVSTKNRTPSDFSSLVDKRRLLRIRAEGDAVMAGAATVAADTMTMGLPDVDLRNARLRRGQAAYPLRVLVSGSGLISPQLRLFSERTSPIVIYTTSRMPASVRDAFSEPVIWNVTASPKLEWRAVLSSLASEFGVQTLVCEGGGALFSGLLRDACVDELCLTFCPQVFGGKTGVTLTGIAGDWFPSSVKARLTAFEIIGQECFTRWKLEY